MANNCDMARLLDAKCGQDGLEMQGVSNHVELGVKRILRLKGLVETLLNYKKLSSPFTSPHFSYLLFHDPLLKHPECVVKGSRLLTLGVWGESLVRDSLLVFSFGFVGFIWFSRAF